VRASHQHRGIGKELIRRTQAELGPGASLVLLAAPAAVGYYPHIGFSQHASAWLLYPGQRVK
jgi:predicted N-acetyltransferase YhbS